MSGAGMRGYEHSGGGQGWNDARIERAKALAAEGWSASQIAADLGGGLSRNAVVGKLHRMGLSTGGGNLAANRAQHQVRRASAPRVAASTHSRNPLGASGARRLAEGGCATGPVIDRHANEVGAVSDMMQLGAHMCRWPFGSGPFTFCGAERGGEGPYCRDHTARAHQRAYSFLSDGSMGLGDRSRKHVRKTAPTFDDFERKAGRA